MKKKLVSISVIVLVLVLALFVLSACNDGRTVVDQELISNGGFEDFNHNDDRDVYFDEWKVTYSDGIDSPYKRQSIESDEDPYEDHGSGYVILTTGGKEGWVKMSQEIAVDRKAVYLVSVDVWVTSLSPEIDRGVYVTFLENPDYAFLKQKNKTNDWKMTQEFYVRPVNTDYLTLSLSIGSEDEPVTGTAYFDNISVKRVDPSTVPEGSTVYDFRMSQIARYNRDLSGTLFVVFLTLATAAFAVCAYVLVKKAYAKADVFVNFDGTTFDAPAPSAPAKGKVKGKGTSKNIFKTPSGKWWTNCLFIAGMLMLGTFLVRLIFLLSMYGFGGEMNATVELARWLASNGVNNVYANATSVAQSIASQFSGLSSHVDEIATAIGTTSPGTMYILAIIGAMGQNLTTDGISVLIRMVGVLADMAIVGMIYFYGRKYAGDKIAVIIAAVYAVLPVVLVMSGMSNTFVSLLLALMVAAVLLLVEKKYIAMYVVMALAAVLDIRALALAPIAVTYLGYMYYKDDDDLKKFGKNRAVIVFGLIGAFVLAYVLTIPVAVGHFGENAFYGMRMIANQMINNNIFVDNAFGFYGMATLNGRGFNSTASILNLVFILVLVVYICSLYFKKRNRQEVLLLASYTLAMVSVFTLKVTYTYLFMTIALGLIYAMVSGEKRVYGIMGGYALLSFICVGLIVKNSGFATIVSDGPIVDFERTGADFIVFSVLTVLLTLYYSYVVYNITNTGKVADIKPLNKPFGTAVKDAFRSIGDVFKKD